MQKNIMKLTAFTRLIMWRPTKTFITRANIKLSSRFALISLVSVMFTSNLLASSTTDTGIKVHGDWVVTVMNPDGSVDKEVFFKNSLVSWGPYILTNLLIGNLAVGIRPDDSPAWNIKFSGPNILSDCAVLNGTDPIESSAINARVSEADNTHFTLTTTLSLPASCIDAASYGINRVWTIFESDDLPNSFVGLFSATEFPAISDIQADQLVTLKVSFSFE